MTKSTFFSRLLIGAFALSGFYSCTDTQDPQLNHDGETVVTFEVSFPEEFLSGRAFSDATGVTKLIYAAYDKDGALAMDGTIDDLRVTKKLDLPLAHGETFTVAFWAQNPDATCYTVRPNEKTVTVEYGSDKANDETRDAFIGKVQVHIETGMATQRVKMSRAMAQLNIATTDFADTQYDAAKVKSSLRTKLPNKLNLVDGMVSGATDVTFELATIPAAANEEFPMGGGSDYTYLSMNYLLVGNDGRYTLPTTEFKLYEESNGSTELFTKTINGVQVQRNYRTNLYGALFTNSVEFEIEISPAFSGDINGGLNGGQEQPTLKYRMDGDRMIYQISTYDDFALLRSTLTTAFDWENKGIELMNDITVPSTVSLWTPIDIPATTSGVTVNGNGHTISGMPINGGVSEQGFLGTATNVQISNISFSNVENIGTGGENIGTVAGVLTGSLSNVSVSGVTLNINGGRNIGGVVGTMHATGVAPTGAEIPYEAVMTSVSVSDVNISGSENVGGFVGQLDNAPSTSRNSGRYDVLVSRSAAARCNVSSGAQTTAGIVIGTLTDNDAYVYYDTFNTTETTHPYHIGSNNSAWRQLGSGPVEPQIPENVTLKDTENKIYYVQTIDDMRTAFNDADVTGGDWSVILTSDINCSGSTVMPISIPVYTAPVVFNGAGHTISNVKFENIVVKDIDDTDRSVSALLCAANGCVKNLEVRNLNFDGVSFDDSDTSSLPTRCAALSVYFWGTIDNVTVKNGKFNSTSATGGIIAHVPTLKETGFLSISNSTVSNSEYTYISGPQGGLVGILAQQNLKLPVTITDCTIRDCNFSSNTKGLVIGVLQSTNNPSQYLKNIDLTISGITNSGNNIDIYIAGFSNSAFN